jgi:hypothetical protein
VRTTQLTPNPALNRAGRYAVTSSGLGRLIVLASVVLSLHCGSAWAQERRDFTFSSKDFGFAEIDTTLTFTAESGHTFRIQYSKQPSHPDLLMIYTSFYFCAARKVALQLGFDRYGVLAEQNEDKSDTAFFLRPGEVAAEALGPRFAAASALPVDYPTIASGCDARASNAKH